MEIKIKLDGGIMPKKAHKNDAAFDLYVPSDVSLHTGRQVVDLRFSLELPHGYAATIQPRSGFSSRGIECDSNGCIYRLDADVIRGLIDENYRGSVGVIVKVNEPNVEMVTLKKEHELARCR